MSTAVPPSPPAASTAARWSVEPFREGSPEDFARLRAFLTRAGYTEAALCERFGIASIYEFKQAREGRAARVTLHDAQSVLAWLFLDSEPLDWDTVRAGLGPDGVEALEALGLLHTPSGHPERCAATVLFYPTEGLWIVSDGAVDPEASQTPTPTDVVYPAITTNTQRFVRLMPRTRCGRFLELCSGTGIAALIAARDFADHAWAVDITARATRFARFNAALNAIENFTALEGDLWAPVDGLVFDTIVAHPPYMPAFENTYVFRDGGEDGEQITRRIVEGLPAHLAAGGLFYCDCLATDRQDAPLESRLRNMLGASADEFDVIVAQALAYDPVLYYARRAREGGGSWEGVGRRQETFERLQVTQMTFGSMLLHRRTRERPVVTLRRQLHPDTTAADFEWLLRWHTGTAGWGTEERRALLDASPRATPYTEVHTTQRREGDGWVVASCTLETTVPFAVEAKCPASFPVLLLRCDGSTTGRALLAWLREGGFVDAEAGEDEFTELLARLISQGFLDVAACPIPERPAARPER